MLGLSHPEVQEIMGAQVALVAETPKAPEGLVEEAGRGRSRGTPQAQGSHIP